MKIFPSSFKESGLTLVDVIMSTAIISVMTIGLVGSLTYGFFVMQMARENQRATQILLEKVETIRLYSWDQVNSNGFIPATFLDVYDPQAPSGQQGVVYDGRVTIGQFTNGVSYATNMRLVTVTLNWNTRNIHRSRSVNTYIARDGVQNYVY